MWDHGERSIHRKLHFSLSAFHSLSSTLLPSRSKANSSPDVSEFHIAAGKLYLSPILDMFNGEIVSYDISTSPNFKQTVDMLNMAFNKHSNLNGLIFQSDQGWQYQMKYFTDINLNSNH